MFDYLPVFGVYLYSKKINIQDKFLLKVNEIMSYLFHICFSFQIIVQ